MFCKHKNLKFIKNLHGDHIAMSGYNRSVWKCEDCGKRIYRKEYYEHRNPKTAQEIKDDLKKGVPVDVAFPPTENISDGYHSFEELYHQRAVLFATICNAYKDKAWKTKRHADGTDCPKGYFVAGVDTVKGNFTYHCEDKYWYLFRVQDIDRAHFDGHTDKDVDRLLTLDTAQK